MFKIGDKVKLTNPFEDEDFRDEHFHDYDEDWRLWWENNLTTIFTIVDALGVGVMHEEQYKIDKPNPECEEANFFPYELERYVKKDHFDEDLFKI